MYTKASYFKPIARVIYTLTLLGLLLGSSLAARAEPGVVRPVAPSATQHTIYLPLVAKPGTAPGGSSSDELIDAALKRGEIDAETALIYRVFVTFVDPRLPAKYRGDDSRPSDREVIGEVIGRYSQLSPQARATLEPFTIPPYHTGSWWDLRQNHALAATSAIAPAELRCGQTGNVKDPLFNQWHYVDSSGGAVRIWWQARYPQDEAKARNYARVVDDMWLKFATLMRRQPPSDEGEQRTCRGGDNRLDISLIDLGHNGVTWPYTTDPVATPSYIVLRRDSGIMTLAHELMHSFQFAYDVAGTYNEYNWWREATAAWAEHFIDPAFNAEHRFAPYFLDEPELPLEHYSLDEGGTGYAHQYGAYLLPLLQQLRSGQPDLARTSWEQFEHFTDSLAALNSLLPGGFGKQWPEFTLRNVNQPPVDDYSKADKLSDYAQPKLKQLVTLGGAPSVAYTLDGNVGHLAAQYYHFQFTDPTVRSVIFENPFADGTFPTARVQALYRIEPSQWAAEDWTDKPYATFCRDVRADRVKELYIVISNSEWRDRSHKLAPAAAPRLQATNVGCRGWKVDAEFTNIIETPIAKQTNTIVTTAIMERYVEPGIRGPAEHYQVTSGTASWTSEGNIGPCTGSMSGTYDVRNTVGGYNMTIEA
ncbi:MAG TPA: hypothetical protein VFO07_10205, partial [Roseiflexaceae bacterium]|nr:hypothetical protein [Roseiflexaceae bacterium]